LSENAAKEKLSSPGTVSRLAAARTIDIVTRCTAQENEVRISIPPSFAAQVANRLRTLICPVADVTGEVVESDAALALE
jgi:hypothetical protein